MESTDDLCMCRHLFSGESITRTGQSISSSQRRCWCDVGMRIMSPLHPAHTLLLRLPGCWQLQPVCRGQSIFLNWNPSEQRDKLLIVVLAKFSEGHLCQAVKLPDKSFSGCEDGDFERLLRSHVLVQVWHRHTFHLRLSEPLLEPASS